jgi:hypothetical protein
MFVLFNKACGSAVYCADWLSFDETLYPAKHQIAFRLAKYYSILLSLYVNFGLLFDIFYLKPD